MDPEMLVFNGVDGATGGYLHAPATAEELARSVLGTRIELDSHLEELKLRGARDEPTMGVAYPARADKLDEAGWAIVAAADAAPNAVAALAPLCRLRREQAGPLFRTFTGDAGVRPGETKNEWLGRHGMGPGDAEPEKVPYYLLIVGGPEEISFRFQYELDVHYAVGRLSFVTPAEYASYAAAAVRAEEADASGPATIALFAPRNPDDRATELSTTQLITPLGAEIERKSKTVCKVLSMVGGEAKKERLRDLLASAEAPDVLFTASHGVGFPRSDPRQRDSQGALVCQEWPGPKASKCLEDEHYLAARDLPTDPRVTPTVVFAFACYGAGTPLLDDFAHLRGKKVHKVAEQPFVGRLPQRLLAHPEGRTLAFVGHVERAWECSFATPEAGPQRGVFSGTLASLLDGRRVGHAMEFFNSRYAGIASSLTTRLNDYAKSRKKIKPTELAALWIATNDARSYAVLGDPAVRLPTPANHRSCVTPTLAGPRAW
jgi:hypothetical protein